MNANLPAWAYVSLAALAVASMFTIAVLWLFYGWKVYRFFTAALTASAAVIAAWVFISPHVPAKIVWLPPLACGIGGALLSFLVARAITFTAMGILGAAVTAAVAVGVFKVPLDVRSHELIGLAAAGFLVAGMPAAIFHRAVVVFITSTYGAGLALVATFELLLVCLSGRFVASAEVARTTLSPWVGRDVTIAVLAAWLAITIVGVVYQYRLMHEVEDVEPEPTTRRRRRRRVQTA